MSDLSNLLGDVYGDRTSPDGPSVRHEAPADERADAAPAPAGWAASSQPDPAFSGWVPGDARTAGEDDLAAALSAALQAEAAPQAKAPAPAPVAPTAPAPMPAAPAPAPMPTMAAAPPPAPAPAPQASDDFADVGPAPMPRPAWSAPANLMATAPEPAMAMAGVSAAPARAWTAGDDDIFPVGKGKAKAAPKTKARSKGRSKG